MRYGNFAGVSQRLMAMLTLVLATAAAAQDFPSRPVHIIVPYSSGSLTDLIARIVGAALSERIRQPVLIENKDGAGGAIGANALRQATPNGYTIGVIVSGNAIQPWLMKDVPFDIRKDFIPITLMYQGQYVFAVAPTYPAKTFPEFIADAKANPEKIFYGSFGTGTTTHLAGEMLEQMALIKMTHVPYKGGPGVVAGTLAGSVQVHFNLYGTVKPLIESGRGRALAVTGKQRMAALPQIPTIAEYYPGFEVLVWTGFAAPQGTPKEVVARLTADLREVLQLADVNKKIVELGVDPGGNSPAEFAQLINDDYERWGKTIKAAGLKPQ